MFTFHKPKVFRSSSGCCICRAKSSSSRFTDSKKYESVFKMCFNLEEKRFGEICNACVLLVKRYLKLPAGSTRHWNHVVDARSGPGIKSLVKTRAKKQKDCQKTPNKVIANDEEKRETEADTMPIKRKHVYRRKRISPQEPVKNCADQSSSLAVSAFLDMNIWKRQKVCCGTIFKGPFGEVVIDPRFLTPCTSCKKSKAEVPDKTDETDAALGEEEEFLLSDASAEEEAEAAGTSGKNDEDDEGFFDKPTVSPNSVTSTSSS